MHLLHWIVRFNYALEIALEIFQNFNNPIINTDNNRFDY